MLLQTIDYARMIAFYKVHHCFGVLVPEENVATITAADDIFGVWAKEVDTLNGAAITIG